MALTFSVQHEAKMVNQLQCSADLHELSNEIVADIRSLEALGCHIDKMNQCAEIVSKLGTASIETLQHSYPDLQKVIDFAASEGFVEAAKEVGGKFVEMVKRVIEKIIAWIKMIYNKLASRYQLLKTGTVSKKLRQAGVTPEQFTAATVGGIHGNGIIGPKVVQLLAHCCAGASSVSRSVPPVLQCKTPENLDVALPKIFFDETCYQPLVNRFFMVEVKAPGDESAYTVEHQITASTRGGSIEFNYKDKKNRYMDEAEASDVKGLDISVVTTLEKAAKDNYDGYLAFEMAVESSLGQLNRSLEKADESQKPLFSKMLKGVTTALKTNLNIMGHINDVLADILGDIEKTVLGNVKKDGTANQKQPVGLRIKAELDKLVQEGNKINAKKFIIRMADKHHEEEAPWILKAADYLNKHLEGGLYDDEVEIDASNGVMELQAALRMNFTRGIISRIHMLLAHPEYQAGKKDDDDDFKDKFMKAVKDHDRTYIIAHILYCIGKLHDRESTNVNYPMSLYDTAAKEFNAAGVALDQDDNGEWLNALGGFPEDKEKWTDDLYQKLRSTLRHRFCKRYLVQCMDVLKYLLSQKKTVQPKEEEV